MFIAKNKYNRSYKLKLHLEYLKRKLLKINENKKYYIQFLNSQKTIKYRLKAALFLKYNSSYAKLRGFTLVKNWCHITGRGRSVVRFAKMSRHEFKNFASFSLFAGISKSS